MKALFSRGKFLEDTALCDECFLSKYVNVLMEIGTKNLHVKHLTFREYSNDSLSCLNCGKKDVDGKT